MIQWHLEVHPINTLKSHPKNPRQISKEQFQHLSDLIAKFGFIDRPIINCDKTIICGHQRIRVLKKMKAKTVECWVPDEQLSDEDVEELLIRHNLNQGNWSYDILGNLFEPLDLLKYGFTEDQLLGSYKEDQEESKEENSSSKKKNECPACGHEF